MSNIMTLFSSVRFLQLSRPARHRKTTNDGKTANLIVFSEFARVAVPDSWPKGYRNPVRYSTLEEISIDPAKLEWKPMPEAT